MLVFDSSNGTTIVDKNFKDAKVFTEGRNAFRMFDHKLFLFPLCRSNHWTLVSVNFIERRISHFEPMSGQLDIAILDKILLYLNYQVIIRNILQPLFTYKKPLLGLQRQKKQLRLWSIYHDVCKVYHSRQANGFPIKTHAPSSPEN